MQIPSKRPRFFLRCLLFLAVGLVFYLHLTALRAADDFYYATFWMEGPARFWQLTLHHYQTFNGRALVHFVAQTVLAFPPLIFALVNTALLAGMGLLAGRLQAVEYRTAPRPAVVFLFLIQLLLLRPPVLTEGLLWASASYNYMLPVFLTVLALWFLMRFLESRRHRPLFFVLFVLVQFAAGATTEQGGLMSIAATGVYGLCWAVQNRKDWWKLFPAPLCSAAGYLTVFLSPATQNRAARGVKLDAHILSANLTRWASALFSWDGILLQVLLAALLLAVCLAIPSVRRGLTRAIPSFWAGALTAAAVMLPTGNFGPRTMLPTALLLTLSSTHCAVLLLSSLYKKAGSTAALSGVAVALAVCIALCTPLLSGVTQNYALELRNRAAVRQARETGVLHYSMDYDERWCYPALMYTDSSFYQRFLQSQGLEGCTVYLDSAVYQPVYLNGQRLFSPAYEQDGQVFFPLRDIVEGFGGSVVYDGGVLTVMLDGRPVQFWPQLLASYSENDAYQELSLDGKTARRYCKASYTADVFQSLFGIQIRWDGDRYLCEKRPL